MLHESLLVGIQATCLVKETSEIEMSTGNVFYEVLVVSFYVPRMRSGNGTIRVHAV